MKKSLLLLGFCLTQWLGAQNNANLVIFSDDGDAFFVHVNGVKQNANAETNVKVTGLPPNVSVKITFENKALPEIKKTMVLEDGFEHTARIKRDMKKQLKLQFFGQVAIAESNTQKVPSVSYHVSEEPAQGGGGQSNTQNNGFNTSTQVNTGANDEGQVTITSSTTTTQGSKKNNNENVNVNMNMGGVGFNMNVSGMDPNVGNENVTTTTTSKTVTTTRSSSGNVNTTKPASENVTTQTNTNARVGCATAMPAANFAKMKQTVESKPFSETKMSTAKIATKGSCLSVNQVKEITKLFSMDDDKLEYAKFAYDYCVDKGNYYTVSEVFSFSATTDDFNKFLEDK